MSKEYVISPEVLADALKLGMDGKDAEARLKQMAKLAARFTHPDANHRFRQYIMMIEKEGDVHTVTMIDTMDTDEAGDYDNRTYEERRAETDSEEATVEYKKK